MAQRVLAPWSEPVPGQKGRMTVEEFGNLPEDGWLHELVEGRLVRMPLPRSRHGRVGNRLQGALGAFVAAQGLGETFLAESGFLLSRPGEPDTVLGADVAFVLARRLPPLTRDPEDEYLRLAPDLVAEVASPSQYRPGMAAKAQLWLASGVRLVWVVWPAAARIDLWRPGDRAPTPLGPGDDVDGLEVVPGFRLPVAHLFR